MSEFHEQSIKIIIVGDSYVGKTALTKRIIDGVFIPDFKTTIGFDYFHKPIDVNGKKTVLLFWDTAGQERYRSISKSYFTNSQIALLVFDLSNIETFNHIESWLNDVKEASNLDRSHLILIGSKFDLIKSKKDGCGFDDQIESISGQFREYYKCSSLTGEGVDDIFEEIKTVSRNLITEESKSGISLSKDGESGNSNKKPCC